MLSKYQVSSREWVSWLKLVSDKGVGGRLRLQRPRNAVQLPSLSIRYTVAKSGLHSRYDLIIVLEHLEDDR